jgi:hypothetical protein
VLEKLLNCSYLHSRTHSTARLNRFCLARCPLHLRRRLVQRNKDAHFRSLIIHCADQVADILHGSVKPSLHRNNGVTDCVRSVLEINQAINPAIWPTLAALPRLAIDEGKSPQLKFVRILIE